MMINRQVIALILADVRCAMLMQWTLQKVPGTVVKAVRMLKLAHGPGI